MNQKNIQFQNYEPYKKTLEYGKEINRSIKVESQKILPNRYSDFLPKSILYTLNNKENLLRNFKNKCEINKEKVEIDLDNALKEVILIFEEFKQQLCSKIDDHYVTFSNIVNQLENLSMDCSSWAEDRVREADQTTNLHNSVDETLYIQLNEARLRRQKADEVEKALLAIKQKIEQMRLNELNSEINHYADDKYPDIYMNTEAIEFTNRFKRDLKSQLEKLDQTKIIRPFKYDVKPKETIPVNNNNVQIPDRRLTPNYISPENNTNDKSYNRINPNVSTIIAQQNHHISDNIELSNPVMTFEQELHLKSTSKIHCLISLTNKLIIVGNDEGNMIIVNVDSQSQANQQLMVKAHNAPVKILSKTNENMIISSSDSPDFSLKLWDLASIIESEGVYDGNSVKNKAVLLIAVLKGHSEAIIGHSFLSGRAIISASRDGIVNIWDWKIPSPVSSLKTTNTRANHFIAFSDRENFAIANSENVISFYNLLKSNNSFEFIKQSEIKEPLSITSLFCFKGNNDIIVVSIVTGEVRLVSKKTGLTLNSIKGCKTPLSFFTITCLKSNPEVFLMAIEPWGFKIVDVDEQEFKYVNTVANSSFRFESNGTPIWQIIDCVPGQRISVMTVNSSSSPNSIILWSLKSSSR